MITINRYSIPCLATWLISHKCIDQERSCQTPDRSVSVSLGYCIARISSLDKSLDAPCTTLLLHAYKVVDLYHICNLLTIISFFVIDLHARSACVCVSLAHAQLEVHGGCTTSI